MIKPLLSALALVASISTLPADAADVAAASVAPRIMGIVEGRIGIPIVELERHDNDPAEFWYRAMQKLCERTGDNWCDDDVHVLQDTTNALGWSRRLAYEADDGSRKEVCVVLPPKQGVAPGYVARALSGSAQGSDTIPSASTTHLWVWLTNIAGCEGNSNPARADAFATLATTLVRGDTGFVSRTAHSDSRWFSAYRNGNANHWATNIGERILLDLWKNEAAQAIRTAPCQVTVVASTSIATDQIRPASRLPEGQDCSSGEMNTFQANGAISDENLWLWTGGGRGNPQTTLPPKPYAPFASFRSFEEGVNYVWDTSAGLR